MTGAPALSPDCLGWARAAGFVHRTDDEAGIVELRSGVGAPIRYVIRRPAMDRVELVEVDELGDERLVLFVTEIKLKFCCEVRSSPILSQLAVEPMSVVRRC